MASKTAPTKKKPTTTTDQPPEPVITVIKEASCRNLQGTATLTYHIGRDDKSELFWKIHANSGAGMFSKTWIPFDTIQKVLDKWPKDSPITSISLAPLCTGSVNTRSFLLATLVHEGILQQVPDKQRHYQIGDTKSFLAGLDKLTTPDSKPGMPKAKAKAKAAARMPKGKAKPATGK